MIIFLGSKEILVFFLFPLPFSSLFVFLAKFRTFFIPRRAIIVSTLCPDKNATSLYLKMSAKSEISEAKLIWKLIILYCSFTFGSSVHHQSSACSSFVCDPRKLLKVCKIIKYCQSVSHLLLGSLDLNLNLYIFSM